MHGRPKSLIDRLREGYERAKKPIAYLTMLVVVLLQSLPGSLIPADLRDTAGAGALIALGLILMEMLFEIYEKTVKAPRGVNLINSNDLYREVREIVADEREVTIQFLGLAGRFGWQNVLEKMLNEHDPDSLAEKVKFDIEVALIEPDLCTPDDPTFGRFEMAGAIARQVERRAAAIAALPNPSRMTLYHYRHMPNMIGILVNGNYLFLTYCWWERQHDGLVLRAGGSDYFVYNKGDDFGGQEVIQRFQGWFDFIREHGRKVAFDAPDAAG
jgi:hypothetical protein